MFTIRCTFHVTKCTLMPKSKQAGKQGHGLRNLLSEQKGNSTEQVVITGCPLSLHKLP